VASKWIRQSAVAINQDKADFADVAMTEIIQNFNFEVGKRKWARN